MTGNTEYRPKVWVPGDWNAFFGLGTNVLLNVLVLSSLMVFVVQLPATTVFGRILPALAIALPIGNLFYAYLAYQRAKKEGRDDVAAMPYGPSVPHYFFVTFVIMLPVLGKTGDVMKAWEAGIAWAFLIGVIVLIGAFIGPTIRRYTPRAAMLGTLAGISVAFISMSASFEMFNAACIAFAAFVIILVGWTANVRLPGNMPAGLVAVVLATVIGWLALAAGWTTQQQLWMGSLSEATASIVLHVPNFGNLSDLFNVVGDNVPLLVTAIPLGVCNF